MEHIVEVRINCPTRQIAEQIAATLLRERLAASASVHAPMQASYHWQGEIHMRTETALVVKTRSGRFAVLTRRVKALHPYQTPSILGVQIEHVDPDYRDWIMRETRSTD